MQGIFLYVMTMSALSAPTKFDIMQDISLRPNISDSNCIRKIGELEVGSDSLAEVID